MGELHVINNLWICLSNSGLQDVDRGRPAPVRSTSTGTALARKQPAGRRAVQAEHQGQEPIPACLSPG
jgi:hypothetical protein